MKIIGTNPKVGYGDRVPFTQPARVTVLFLMIWGAVWNSVFISTVFPVITLNQSEFKAFNLFERTNKRNELEEISSYILTNSMRILGQLNSKINRHINTEKLDKT